MLLSILYRLWQHVLGTELNLRGFDKEVWTDKAKSSLKEIYYYIKEDSF
jgi:hypothetical protein